MQRLPRFAKPEVHKEAYRSAALLRWVVTRAPGVLPVTFLLDSVGLAYVRGKLRSSSSSRATEALQGFLAAQLFQDAALIS